MGAKKSTNQTVRQSSLAKAILRTLFWALILSGWWLLVGWALISVPFGTALALWSLVIAPLILPPIFWLLGRVGGRRFRQLSFAQEPALAQESFSGILYRPGPNPRLWVEASSQITFFWFESLFSLKSHQEVIVSSTWLRQTSAQKAHDWKILWRQISALSLGQRKLRSFQIAMWIGMLSPLIPLFALASFLVGLLGFKEIPRFEFFALRFAWDLKRIWFGGSREFDRGPPTAAMPSSGPPDALNSLLWGVWVQIPARAMHPAWTLLTHRDSILDFEALS